MPPAFFRRREAAAEKCGRALGAPALVSAESWAPPSKLGRDPKREPDFASSNDAQHRRSLVGAHTAGSLSGGGPGRFAPPGPTLQRRIQASDGKVQMGGAAFQAGVDFADSQPG